MPVIIIPLIVFVEFCTRPQSDVHSENVGGWSNISAKICVFLATYQDSGYLDVVLKSVEGIASEIVVADGPRGQSIEILTSLGVLYHEIDSPIKKLMLKYAEEHPDIVIKYKYNVWTKESDQRNYGFRECSSPYMLQIDSDMLVNIDLESLDWFLKNDSYIVAQVDMVHIFHPDQMLSLRDNYGGPLTVRYPLFAKRDRISAESYFDYLWIVGEEQMPINTTIISPRAIGSSYHLTSYASKEGMLGKYAFYVGSYYQNAMNESTRFYEDMSRIKKLLGQEELQHLFLRRIAESSVGVKLEEGTRYTKMDRVSTYFAQLLNSVKSKKIKYVGFKDKFTIWDGWPCWFNLDSLKLGNFEILAEGPFDCQEVALADVSSTGAVSLNILSGYRVNNVTMGYQVPTSDEIEFRFIKVLCSPKFGSSLGISIRQFEHKQTDGMGLLH